MLEQPNNLELKFNKVNPMNIFKYTTSTVITSIAVMTAPAANAQFVGDIFSSEPSVIASTGDVASVSFEAFIGDAPFGASQITLTYDPSLLKYNTVQLDSRFNTVGGNYVEEQEGELNIILANTESLTMPRGTVDLFQINFEVLADSGTVPVNIVNNGLLLADSTDITGRGFGAEIVLVSGNAPILALKASNSLKKPLVVTDKSPLFNRVTKLARRGHPVTIKRPDGGEDVVISVQEGE